MATLALPSGVLAPVECSHGRHVRINSACLALASSVHLGISYAPVISLVRGISDLSVHDDDDKKPPLLAAGSSSSLDALQNIPAFSNQGIDALMLGNLCRCP